MEELKVTIKINENGIHISRPGHAGTGFDAGERGEELPEGLQDLATWLLDEYKAKNKGSYIAPALEEL